MTHRAPAPPAAVPRALRLRRAAASLALAGGLILSAAGQPGPARAQEAGAPASGQGCAAGPGPCAWARTVGDAGIQKGHALAPRPGGGWIVAASRRPALRARDDAWVLALDAGGRLLWERRLGGPQTDRLLAVAGLGDGTVALAGHTRSEGSGESDVWVLRLGAAGETLWRRSLGGPANDRARAVAPAPDGGVYVAGFTASAGGGGRDAWVLRLDAGGSVIWSRTLGGAGDEGAAAAVAMPGGGVALTGHAGGAGGYDLWAAVLAPTGETVWRRRIGRSHFDAGTGIAPAPDGGVIVAGVTGAAGSGFVEDAWAMRLGPGGATLWERVLGGAGRDAAWAVAADGAGGALIAGTTASRGAGSADAWLLHLDATGATRRERVIGGALWDRPAGIARDAAGRVAVAGTTTSAGAGYEDVWVFAPEP